MAAAPYGSSLILPISYAYISMMGSQALTNVSQSASIARWLDGRLPGRSRAGAAVCWPCV